MVSEVFFLIGNRHGYRPGNVTIPIIQMKWRKHDTYYISLLPLLKMMRAIQRMSLGRCEYSWERLAIILLMQILEQISGYVLIEFRQSLIPYHYVLTWKHNRISQSAWNVLHGPGAASLIQMLQVLTFQSSNLKFPESQQPQLADPPSGPLHLLPVVHLD